MRRVGWFYPVALIPHCHIEQLSAGGIMNADDWESATRSAAFGATTTVIPFACQHRGMRLRDVASEYHELAGRGALGRLRDASDHHGPDAGMSSRRLAEVGWQWSCIHQGVHDL